MDTYVATPTSRGDLTATRAYDLDQSMEKSFRAPEGHENVFAQARGGRAQTFATPSARRPPAANRPGPAKNEFTPLLRSATTNRAKLLNEKTVGRAAFDKSGKPMAPAASRPDAKWNSHLSLPDMSIDEASDSTSVADSRLHATPTAPTQSSSDPSTPTALPKTSGDEPFDRGNMLTLKEQEVKLAEFDKENFGLKLKIFYLEENLKKTGGEHQYATLRENSELQTERIQLMQELKKYKKTVKTAEQDLDEYRRQLQEYAGKVKQRHANEDLQEALEEARRIAEQRAFELEEMQNQLASEQHDEAELENLKGELDEMEEELRDKDQLLDRRDAELRSLQERLGSADDRDEELREKDRQMDDLMTKMQVLEEQVSKKEKAKNERIQGLEELLRLNGDQKDQELRRLEAQLHEVHEKRERHAAAEDERRQAFEREKDMEMKALQRQAKAIESEKQAEIDRLMDRMRLAESQGENRTQLAQQALQDARRETINVSRSKSVELELLQTRLDSAEAKADELEDNRKLLKEAETEIRCRQAAETSLQDEINRLRSDFTRTVEERHDAARQVHELRSNISKKEVQLAALSTTVQAQDKSRDEIKDLREMLERRSRETSDARAGLKSAQSSLEDRARELETARKTIRERDAELEALHDHADEPDTQLEVVQTLVRERDHDLQTVRQTVDSQRSQIEALTQTTEERQAAIKELESVLATTKEDLEDEIEIMQETCDELAQEKQSLEARAAALEEEVENLSGLKSRIEPLERDLSAANREKGNLHSHVHSLEKELDIADQSRKNLEAELKKLKAKLDTVQEAANTDAQTRSKRNDLNPEPATSRREVENDRSQLEETERKLAETERRLRQEIRDQKTQMRNDESEVEMLQLQVAEQDGEIELLKSKLRNHSDGGDTSRQDTRAFRELKESLRIAQLDIEDLQSQLVDRERRLAKLKAGGKHSREQDKKMQVLQQSFDVAQKQLQSAQKTSSVDVMDLKQSMMDKEKRHAGELKGLAKQIQYLRARCSREEGFREGLGYQKRFFLMQIEVYGQCNQQDLRLIEEMGITPDLRIRERKPSLRTAALAVMAILRMRRLQREWAGAAKVHESLVKKLEQMRTMGKRGGAPAVASVGLGPAYKLWRH